jgi:hypothetical protein
VADTPRHPDDVACAISPSNEVRRVVWPLGTRLASDLGRARQKCLSVPYGELAYVRQLSSVIARMAARMGKGFTWS